MKYTYVIYYICILNDSIETDVSMSAMSAPLLCCTHQRNYDDGLGVITMTGAPLRRKKEFFENE